jgi:hypothetical protein
MLGGIIWEQTNQALPTFSVDVWHYICVALLGSGCVPLALMGLYEQNP